MNIARDIADTFRASRWGSSNWPAHHACASLLVCLLSLPAASWLAYDGQLAGGAVVLVLALMAFAYWRYLLPKALWYSKVERTLHGR
jgi:hypothetical protein